ncbi:protein of unknown function [Mesotoga infera]|uniref:Uncharacterized protein n=1 Tax=Mesotoga infera TaxID=1236046 RepID=A0A7Z7LEQ8_9BACT|nr:protein of unknown function [Mesotoga infera]
MKGSVLGSPRFQFLIGSLEACGAGLQKADRGEEFQFLIGSLEANPSNPIPAT